MPSPFLQLATAIRKPLMPGKREQITIKIPKVLLERLNVEADRSGRKRSDIILQAIAELMDRAERDRGSEPKSKKAAEPQQEADTDVSAKDSSSAGEA